MGSYKNVLDIMFLAAWVLFEALTAVVVFYRFRLTGTGILVGGAFAVYSFKTFALYVFTDLILRNRPSNDPAIMAVRIASLSFLTLLLLLIAVGIALIPRSLKKLANHKEAATTRRAQLTG